MAPDIALMHPTPVARPFHRESWVLRNFARFAFLTGWRRGEIISLRWSDVDRDGGAIRLRPENSKNGKGRVVPFDVLPQLAALMKRREEARLVENPAGELRIIEWVFHHSGDPIGDFRKAWASACIAAGLYHVETDSGTERKVHEKLFHDLRRTAVRNMVRAGLDPAVAMKISGHRTRSVFDATTL